MASNVILLVIDQPGLRVAFNQCLRGTEHRLVFALDGEDGFDRFKEAKPDLIIAHIHAPRLDGEFLCQLVRKERGGDKVPFFLLGEELTDGARTQGRIRSAGADGAIPVPFDARLLFERLAHALAFGRLSTEGSSKAELRPDAPKPEQPKPDTSRPETRVETVRGESVREPNKPNEARDPTTLRAEAPKPDPAPRSEVSRGGELTLELPELPRPEPRPRRSLPPEARPIRPEPHVRPDPEVRDARREPETRSEARRNETEAREARRQETEARTEARRQDAEARDARRQDAEARDARRQDAEARDARRQDTEARRAETEARDVRRQETEPKRVEPTRDLKRPVGTEAVTLLDTSAASLGAQLGNDPLVTIDGDEPVVPKPLTAEDDEIPTGVGLARPNLDVEAEPFDPLAEPEAPIPVSQQRDREEDTRVEHVSAASDLAVGGEPKTLTGRAAESLSTEELVVPSRSEPLRKRLPGVVPTEAIAPNEDSQLMAPETKRPHAPETRAIAESREFTREEEAGLLEEPMLPDPAERGEMLDELPRDATPSNLEPLEHKGDKRSRRGLDESQLGRRLSKRVRAMFDALDELDYYELLGVEREANRAAIRDAYFALSLEFHPDRFFFVRSGDLKEKIYSVYRRVSEAYAVLSDERRRAQYDAGLTTGQIRSPASQRPIPMSRTEPPPPKRSGKLEVVSRVPEARRLIEHAVTALEDDDKATARLFFTLALVHDRGNRALERAAEHAVG